MRLIHIVYVSTLVVADPSLEVARILEVSHRNNSAAGITGLLLLAGRNVMQVLEGEAAAVEGIYGRVRRDTRHKQIFEILNRTIEQRDFERWSMGFHHVDAVDARRLPEQAPWFQTGFDGAEIQARPGIALELLRQFSRQNY